MTLFTSPCSLVHVSHKILINTPSLTEWSGVNSVCGCCKEVDKLGLVSDVVFLKWDVPADVNELFCVYLQSCEMMKLVLQIINDVLNL